MKNKIITAAIIFITILFSTTTLVASYIGINGASIDSTNNKIVSKYFLTNEDKGVGLFLSKNNKKPTLKYFYPFIVEKKLEYALKEILPKWEVRVVPDSESSILLEKISIVTKKDQKQSGRTTPEILIKALIDYINNQMEGNKQNKRYSVSFSHKGKTVYILSEK